MLLELICIGDLIGGVTNSPTTSVRHRTVASRHRSPARRAKDCVANLHAQMGTVGNAER